MDCCRNLLSSMKTGVLLAALALGLMLLTGCKSEQIKAREAGIELYNQQNYPAALEKFNKALSFNESSAEDNYYAGISHLEQGHLVQAEYHFKLAWQANPGIGELKQALTEVLIREGKTDEAIAYLERDAQLTAKVKDPRWQKSISNRRYMSEIEEAMFIGRAGDRLRIARTYEKLGDFDNAKVYFEQAKAMAPNGPKIRLAVGEYYGRIGNVAVARDEISAAYRLDPKTPGLAEAMAKYGLTAN